MEEKLNSELNSINREILNCINNYTKSQKTCKFKSDEKCFSETTSLKNNLQAMKHGETPPSKNYSEALLKMRSSIKSLETKCNENLKTFETQKNNLMQEKQNFKEEIQQQKDQVQANYRIKIKSIFS